MSALWIEMRIHHGEFRPFSEFYASFYPTGRSKDYPETLMVYLASLEILYSRILPKKSVIQCVNSLAKKNEIYYLTSRPDHLKFVTGWTLKQWGFPSLENLIFSGRQAKSVYLNSLSADVFVEDMPNHAEDAIKNTSCRVFIVDQPHNTWYNGATRISSIVELESLL